MAKRSRMSKFSRRRAIDGQKNRTVVAFVVAIVVIVLLSVVVSVAVGLALGSKADGIEVKKEYELIKAKYKMQKYFENAVRKSIHRYIPANTTLWKIQYSGK